MSKTILCIEGYGAKRREDENTLSNSVTEAILQSNQNDIYFSEVWSNKRSSLKQIEEFIERTENNQELIIFAKSYGCIRFLKYMYKHYTTLRIFKKVTIMFVDPHGAFVGDGKLGPYCKRQPIVFENKMIGDNMKIYGVYQHNKYPTGAEVKGKNCYSLQLYQSSINHTNIVNSNTVKEFVHKIIIGEEL
jgi:hypothetical protein